VKNFEEDELSKFLEELISLAIKKEADYISIEPLKNNLQILFF